MIWLAYVDPGDKDTGTPVLTYVLVGVGIVVLLLVVAALVKYLRS